MRYAFFEMEGWEEQHIKQSFPTDDILLVPTPLTATDIPVRNDFEVISVFVNSRIDAAVLDHFPQLKCIATRSTGYDHIDIIECAKRGITVVYVPGYGDNTVAEFAFGLILNLTRKMYLSIDRVKETDSFSLQGLRGVDIKGKILGIIGTGRIGRETAKIAKGFGMEVIAYDPHPDSETAAKLGITYKSLEDLLASSDVISIHCPSTKDTHHLLNAKNLPMVKRGAYLINTARGEIVETEALVVALKEGTLAGYGTDVLEEEGETKDELHFLATGHPRAEELTTIIQNHVLMDMPNVLITPHNAFNTQEALERILSTTIQNIQGYALGTITNKVPAQ
jgi:D-lactate dehydrogenase